MEGCGGKIELFGATWTCKEHVEEDGQVYCRATIPADQPPVTVSGDELRRVLEENGLGTSELDAHEHCVS